MGKVGASLPLSTAQGVVYLRDLLNTVKHTKSAISLTRLLALAAYCANIRSAISSSRPSSSMVLASRKLRLRWLFLQMFRVFRDTRFPATWCGQRLHIAQPR